MTNGDDRTVEINCEKCSRSLFSRTPLPGSMYREETPPLPGLFRTGGAAANSQIFCPYCGHTNSAEQFIPKVRTGHVNRIIMMASANNDPSAIDETCSLDPPDESLTVRTIGLNPVVEAFRNNIARIDRLFTSPALTVGLTSLEGAKYSTHSNIGDDGGSTPPQALVDLFRSHVGLYLDLSSDKREDAIKRGKSAIKTWLFHHPDIKIGQEAIFSSQIVSLWTALETLFSDLWEGAINIHPYVLAKLDGEDKRIGRLAENPSYRSPAQATKKERRAIGIGELARVSRGTFQLGSLMGTALKDNFNFIRLDGIREAYSAAFSADARDIDRALADNAIDAVSVARNVLVHSAGMADDEYIRRSRKISVLPTLGLGEQFPLTGDVHKQIITPAISVAVRLIRSVDEWIAKNSA